MFQIHEMTEVRLATFTKREELHGDEKVAAVSIGVVLTGANTLLDAIDPQIRQSLYKAVEGQDQLPGVEPATPVLRCNSFGRHALTAAYEGWTLCVDDGIDDTQPMTFGGCKVDKFFTDAKQGGSIEQSFRIGTSDLDAERLGKLGMLHGHSMWITLTAPLRQPDAIDASSSATDLPPDAGDLFAAGADDGDAADDGDEPQELEGRLDKALDKAFPGRAAGEWPFPDKPNNSMEAPPQEVIVETSRPGTRTARGRAATKAALAAGLAAAESEAR